MPYLTENSAVPTSGDGHPPALSHRTTGMRATSPLTELEQLAIEYAATRNERVSDRLRDRLVQSHQPLVRSLALRFRGVSESVEDLIQVGNIGLINAIDRYDPNSGNRFSTYATPTILGEIKRHFRDKAVGIRVPAHVRELDMTVRRTTLVLTQELRRAPTDAELAARLGVTEEKIEIALSCREAINLRSLDTHFEGSDSDSLAEHIGVVDKALSSFESYSDLNQALASLDMRERDVIRLRFVDELSQTTIANQLGISQMHVSRLQHHALKRLREMLRDDMMAIGVPPPISKPMAEQKARRARVQ